MKKIVLSALLFSIVGFAQTEETIISGNSKLHFKTFGKGKPILIINGGPGMNCEGFAFIAQELAKMNYQTIIYDQRGTGKSTLKKATSQTVTMDLMVKDIENLRSHLKFKTWIVFGHSFGGIMAAYYASKHPEAIDKLIFSSSGGINMNFTTYASKRMFTNLTQTEKDSLDYYQAKIDKGDTSEETKILRAKYLAFAYVFNKKNAPVIAKRLTQTRLEINQLVFGDLRKIEYDCAGKFKNFKKSVIVLEGKNDIITTDTAKEIADAFPNSKLVLIDNCGHYGWLDAPTIYFDSIKTFLNN